MERVLATGITIFFRPCPSLLTDSTFSNPSADNLDTSRDTALGLRWEALAKSAIEYLIDQFCLGATQGNVNVLAAGCTGWPSM